MTLAAYRQKRKFQKTPEPPPGKEKKANGPLTFVVQRHQASRLHYDFRLELDGVLKSWAVPKGPSMNPEDKRLAMMVEDHPLGYASFEGIIPKGNYGAGTVMVWDQGVYSPIESVERKKAEKILLEQLKIGHLTFVLLGEKLRGEFALVRAPRMGDTAWLLIKAGDEYASKKDILDQDRSVVTHRSMDEIKHQALKKDEIWYSKPKKLELDALPKGKMPQNARPMLAHTSEEAFDDPQWLFEIKWDGYRAIAEIESGKVKLYSRNGINYNDKYSAIAQALKKFPGNAVVDGEVVVLDKAGRSSFQALQSYPDSPGELVYYIFDLLYFDGHLLTSLPLVQRKELLRQILPPLPHIRYGDYVAKTGKAFFSAAQQMNLEGIMAKRIDSEYALNERSRDWLKIKTQMHTEAIIAGFTRPKGNREHLGALVLGRYDEGKLTYIGHAGGGFNEENLERVLGKLLPLAQKECPFATVPKTNAPVTWVQPRLSCEVEFKEWTKDQQMRHPVFRKLLEEETASEAKEEISVKVGTQTLKLSNLSKVFWPKERYTKADLLYYYSEICQFILPYLKDRPESLLRFPDGVDGERFFQKNTSNLKTRWIKTVAVKSEARTIKYLLCQDKASLLYVINLGCVDLNPWNSRVGHLDYPDYLVLDLDPEKASFDKVITVALTARDILEQLEIESYCKTSGKRGMHIYIPMGAQYTYEQARQFSQLLCLQIQKKLPTMVSLKRSPEDRRGKIYLDYLRNGHGQTTASVYSLRAWPGATVSTPLLWKEVTKKLSPEVFTMKTMLKRLDTHGDLFKGVMGKGIDVAKVLKKIERVENSIIQ